MTSYLSNLYLKCLGGIFAIAFFSYYVQYPALSSRSGIDPSENIFRQTYPSLYANIIEKGYCDADSFVELMNVLGVIISVVIASGTLHHGLLFVGVTCLYRFLVVLGSSMYISMGHPSYRSWISVWGLLCSLENTQITK